MCNQNPIRVLQVVTTLNVGGLETFIMNVYRHIDKKAVQFDFLCHREGSFAYSNEAKSLGARIYNVPRCNPMNPLYRSELNAFFGNHRYEVVHSHIDCMSAFPLSAARKAGARIRIAHAHSSSLDRDKKYHVKQVCKRFIPKEATHLLACGTKAGNWLFGGAAFDVVPNGIDVDAFAFDSVRRTEVRSSLELSRDSLVVAHVGRFSSVKNHRFLIQVFADLLNSIPSAILLLVGDGELKVEAKALAKRLGIAESVRFLGLRHDVPDIMCASDVFVLPSLYEGLPLVLVEAQASGLPCLVSSGVPTDCDLPGGHVERLQLTDSMDEWASMLAVLASMEVNRRDGETTVRSAGFDASSVAKWLQGLYLGVL